MQLSGAKFYCTARATHGVNRGKYRRTLQPGPRMASTEPSTVLYLQPGTHMASTEPSTVVLYSQGHAWRQQRQVPYWTARATHGVNRGKYRTVQPGPRMASKQKQVPSYCTARATHGVNRAKYRCTVQPGPRMATTEPSTVVLYSQGHVWRQQRQAVLRIRIILIRIRIHDVKNSLRIRIQGEL